MGLISRQNRVKQILRTYSIMDIHNCSSVLIKLKWSTSLFLYYYLQRRKGHINMFNTRYQFMDIPIHSLPLHVRITSQGMRTTYQVIGFVQLPQTGTYMKKATFSRLVKMYESCFRDSLGVQSPLQWYFGV